MIRQTSQNLRPQSLKTTPKETLLAQRLKEALEKHRRQREAEGVE